MAVDKRRADLAIPYVHVPEKSRKSPTSTFSSTLPMAAMFMRSKILSWCAMFTAMQVYLNEPEIPEGDGQPGWMTLVIAFVGLGVCYMDFVGKRPVPKAAQKVAETVIEAATETVAETLAQTMHKLAN